MPSHKTIISSLILSLFLISPCLAQDIYCEVLGAGRFERTSKVKRTEKTEYGKKSYIADSKLVEERTHFSKADIPFRFGIKYKLHAGEYEAQEEQEEYEVKDSKGKVKVTFRCYHPYASGWGEWADKPLDAISDKSLGGSHYRTFNILKPGNYVSGKWTLAIIVDGRTLASRDFYFE